MTATISAANGAGSTVPLTILSPWETQYEARNVIHDLIGGDVAVSLVAPRPRNGSMDLLYATESDAFAAIALHREETTFTLTDTDRPSVSMSYVTDGNLGIRLDESTLSAWIVSVGYQELTP
jgi:hypothetical protein